MVVTVSYEIVAKIGVISTDDRGNTTEVNIINWHNTKDKLDIRRWFNNHEKAGKGITLTVAEAKALASILTEYFGEVKND